MDDGAKSVSIIKILRKFGGREAEYADWHYTTLSTIGLHKPDTGNLLSGTWAKPEPQFGYDYDSGRGHDINIGGHHTAGEGGEGDEANTNEGGSPAAEAAAEVQQIQQKLDTAQGTVDQAAVNLANAKDTLSKKQTENTKAAAQKEVDKMQLIKSQPETIVKYLKIDLLRAQRGDTTAAAAPPARSDRTASSDRLDSSASGRPINHEEIDRWMDADRQLFNILYHVLVRTAAYILRRGAPLDGSKW